MYRPRIIPVLLVKNNALVKTVQFKNERYIGDPINAVRIFNAFRADEIIILDIDASRNDGIISLSLVKDVGEEANMPFSVGGGIRTLKQIEERIGCGSERVILNTIVFDNPDVIKRAVLEFGSSTLAACLDIKKDIFGRECIYTHGGTRKISGNVVEHAKRIEQLGIGEIIVQSIVKDGKMAGYDIPLIKKIAESVSIPVTALGGAASLKSMKELYSVVKVNGVAAGSMFVYHGERRGILVNYPKKEDIMKSFTHYL